MSKFRIELDTDGEAFDALNYEFEVNRILAKVQEKIADGDLAGPLFDSNGNTVGHFDTEAR